MKPAEKRHDPVREHARQLVATWPPLNNHQRIRLAVLMRPEPTPAAAPLRQAA